MFLIRKGEEPKMICRACGKLHPQADCPRVREAKSRRQEFVQLIARAKQLAAEGAR